MNNLDNVMYKLGVFENTTIEDSNGTNLGTVKTYGHLVGRLKEFLGRIFPFFDKVIGLKDPKGGIRYVKLKDIEKLADPRHVIDVTKNKIKFDFTRIPDANTTSKRIKDLATLATKVSSVIGGPTETITSDQQPKSRNLANFAKQNDRKMQGLLKKLPVDQKDYVSRNYAEKRCIERWKICVMTLCDSTLTKEQKGQSVLKLTDVPGLGLDKDTEIYREVQKDIGELLTLLETDSLPDDALRLLTELSTKKLSPIASQAGKSAPSQDLEADTKIRTSFGSRDQKTKTGAKRLTSFHPRPEQLAAALNGTFKKNHSHKETYYQTIIQVGYHSEPIWLPLRVRQKQSDTWKPLWKPDESLGIGKYDITKLKNVKPQQTQELRVEVSYEGTFTNGTGTGKEIRIAYDGDGNIVEETEYEGEFINGLKSGPGTLTASEKYIDGKPSIKATYKGAFKNDHPNGEGKLVRKIKEKNRDGTTTLTRINYSGNFTDGQEHEAGQLEKVIEKDGEIQSQENYEGGFCGGFQYGVGKSTEITYGQVKQGLPPVVYHFPFKTQFDSKAAKKLSYKIIEKKESVGLYDAVPTNAITKTTRTCTIYQDETMITQASSKKYMDIRPIGEPTTEGIRAAFKQLFTKPLAEQINDGTWG